MSKRKVIVTQAGGDWFVVPKDKHNEFAQCVLDIELTEKYSEEWYNLIDIFEIQYGDYRTGGDINNVELYADI